MASLSKGWSFFLFKLGLICLGSGAQLAPSTCNTSWRSRDVDPREGFRTHLYWVGPDWWRSWDETHISILQASCWLALLGKFKGFWVSPPLLGRTNPGVPRLTASVYTDSSVWQPCTLPILCPNMIHGRHIGTQTIIINRVSVTIMPYLPNAYCAVEAIQNPVKFLFWRLLLPWKGNRDTERIMK